MVNNRNEKIAEGFIFAQMFLFAFFPLLVHEGAKIMPPILFAGLSTITAGIFLLIYLIVTGQTGRLFDKKAFLYMLGVTVFIIVIPSIFVFLGSSRTSSINTAIFLQGEILFTFLICGYFFKEHLTLQRFLGSVAIILGATFVLYNGEFKLNLGDLLIVIGTIFYPIGNIYAKKALAVTTPITILCVRNVLGGLTLLCISYTFESYSLNQVPGYISSQFLLILANGIGIYALTKILWYEGLKRTDISKAISIDMGVPAVSLIYAFLFLHEIPTVYQFCGLFVIIVGLVILTRKKTDGIAELG